jgi:hypothetical protein
MTPGPAVGLPHRKLEEIFDACIQNLPHRAYRAAVHRFLAYLQTDFPQVLQLSELRRDLLEMYRRQLQDEKARRNLQRLDKRLSTVIFELDRLTTAEK